MQKPFESAEDQHHADVPAGAPTDEAYRMLIEQAQAGVCVVRKGCFQFVNAKLAEMAGRTVEEMLNMPVSAAIHPADMPMIEERSRLRVMGVPELPFDVRCIRKDGSQLDARACNQRIIFNGISADLVTLTDITEVKEAVRTSEWRARMLAQTEQLCRSGSAEIDLTTGRITLSVGMYGLLGGQPHSRSVSRRALLAKWMLPDERQYVAAIWSGATPGEPFEFQHRLQRADGKRIVVLHRGIVEAGADGKSQRGIAILQDITAQHEAERRIQELANYDDVTGLPNRALLLDRIDGALHAARREDRNLALLSINIDQVQQVKQSIGYPAGDALAMAIAARLKHACSEEDTPAHLGGGEFAVLIDPNGNADEQTILNAARAVEAVLSGSEQLGNTEVFLTCGIGVAMFPADADSAQHLLEASQAAMRNATEQDGDGRVCFFKPQANARAVRRLALESALRHAVERNELYLHYQPQLDLSTGAMIGVEALLRWRNEGLGPLSPAEFIPVAEETGLIVPIGEWVLREACEQIVKWQQAGMSSLRVGVNLSTCQLRQPDLAKRVQTILLETGADPERLGVEVTESMLAEDVSHAALTLAQLRALGIKISLDDFGTGYSNLSYLHTLPIDVIKIDRSFVHDITAEQADASVTRAVITMAHSLQMKVLAEGVETEGQLALLIANGCDQMQGYFFSRPVSPQDIEVMVRENRCLPQGFIQHDSQRRTLLLVDDEENILAALRRLLRRDGYNIVTASSAAEGLQKLAEANVDVILTDQRMPDMTGVEFLRRAKDLYPGTMRMMLSGHAELQPITDAVNEGAVYKFLTKPWDDERLRVHVEEAFQHKEMADENRRLAREVQVASQEMEALNHRLQQLLSTQREQMTLEEGRVANTREVLESVPAPIIGVDVEGMIAFLNRDAEALLPDASTLLGRDAEEALPPELRQVWRCNDGIYRSVALEGRRYWAVCRSMSGDSKSRGKLLVITPDTAEEPH